MKTLPTRWLLLFLVVLLQSPKIHATDVPIDITGISDANYAGILPGFASGTQLLGGVTFDIPSGFPYFGTTYDQSVLSATLSTNIANVEDVCLLLNTSDTYTSEMSVGDQIGEVTLTFASGSPEVVPLDVGVNIREWAIGTTAQPVINTFTSSSLQNVWTGDNNGGILSAIDMLTIPVSDLQTLTGITVADDSAASIGQDNPGVLLRGVTVQAVPEPSANILLVITAAILGGVFVKQKWARCSC